MSHQEAMIHSLNELCPKSLLPARKRKVPKKAISISPQINFSPKDKLTGITDTAEREEVSNCGININREGTSHCAQDLTGKSILKYLIPIAAGIDISKFVNLQTPCQHRTVTVCHAVFRSRCVSREWVGVSSPGSRLAAPGQKVLMGRGRVGLKPRLKARSSRVEGVNGLGKGRDSTPGSRLEAHRKEYSEINSKC